MRCRNCLRFEGCEQPNTSARVPASGVKDADAVEPFVLRWNCRTRRRVNRPEVHRESKRSLMRKTFKYRLYPTATQQELLRQQLSEACRLYNAALKERTATYRKTRTPLNSFPNAAQLTEIR